VFDPKNLDGAVAAMAAAQEPNDGAVARADAARRKIIDCDKRLANLRRQIEGGNPPNIVMTWIREVEDERLAAERELAPRAAAAKPLSEAEIRALVRSKRKVLRSLAKATAEQRAAIYREMPGLKMTYDPATESVAIEVDACIGLRVGGGT
jgi:hypothetical protein